MAGFGTPWPDARNLDISFPADQVSIKGQPNNINQALSPIATSEQWQELALRAFQTWAIHADINVGLRSDHNLPLGSPGLASNDPRFGDFRIAGFAQPEVLANSLPFQTVAGTWSGDILLSTQQPFSYHDWAGDLPPIETNGATVEHDLFTVLLHEAGNVFGLPDTLNTQSVMFGFYTAPKGQLTAQDIADLQSLYGARTDPFELIDNGSLSTATIVPSPVGFDAESEKISLRGSILNFLDQDVYQHTTVAGKSSVTVSVNAAGLSLLKPKLEVLDVNGDVIASSQAVSVFDNDVSLTINDLSNQSDLRVRVSASQDDVYAAGDYVLVVDYRSPETRANDISPGVYDGGIELLGTNFVLADGEVGLNDTVLTAIALASNDSYATNSRYELVSSVSSDADRDLWKVRSPTEPTDRLIVYLAAIGANAPDLLIQVVDGRGQSVGTKGYLRNDGTWVMEVAQPIPDSDYLIRISVDPNSVVDVGNYVTTAEFVTYHEQMNQFVSGSVSSEMERFVRWTSMKTRLYRFDLASTGGTADQAVRLTIYDAQTKAIVLKVATPSGNSRSVYAVLAEGDYVLRFTAISRVELPVDNVNFTLLADGISDDMDPNSNGNNPDYYYYDYEYGAYYDEEDYIPGSEYYYDYYIPWYYGYDYYYYYEYNYGN